MDHLEKLLAHVLRNASQICATDFIQSFCVLRGSNLEKDIWKNRNNRWHKKNGNFWKAQQKLKK